MTDQVSANFEILDERVIKDRLAKIMVDGQHWVIVTGFDGIRFMMAFEERFYWNEANVDFELVGLLDKGLHVGMGLKSRCSPAQMAEFINERFHPLGDIAGTEVTAALMEQRDVLFWGQESEGDSLGRGFYDWIQEAIKREEASRN